MHSNSKQVSFAEIEDEKWSEPSLFERIGSQSSRGTETSEINENEIYLDHEWRIHFLEQKVRELTKKLEQSEPQKNKEFNPELTESLKKENQIKKKNKSVKKQSLWDETSAIYTFKQHPTYSDVLLSIASLEEMIKDNFFCQLELIPIFKKCPSLEAVMNEIKNTCLEEIKIKRGIWDKPYQWMGFFCCYTSPIEKRLHKLLKETWRDFEHQYNLFLKNKLIDKNKLSEIKDAEICDEKDLFLPPKLRSSSI